MSVDLTASIVRILKPDGTTAGTGFVVSDEGLIATCAHVVQSEKSQRQGEPRPEYVDLVFHITGDRRRAKVELDWWRPVKAEDVAILHLEGPLPKGAKPLPLGSSQASRGHEFTSRGYRLAEHFPEGLQAEGKIQGSTSYQGQPVLQLLTNQIDRGMSGAPIWDVKGRRVVGMVNTFWETSRHIDAWLAFATPTETLRAVCPDLVVSDVCPYRSLDAFTENDAEFFFGRGRVVERLVESLRHEPCFLAVLGPSGSGKSSLVQAGLIPGLREGAVPGSDRWGVIIARPANQPFGQLEAQGLEGASENLIEAVQAWLACHTEQTRLVLIIDQFEELLVACPEELCEAFVAQLTGLLKVSLPVTVVLAMRDDFYSRFARQSPDLLRWLERGLLVNVPLTLERDELQAIVEEPAQGVGLEFEPGLGEAIVEDAMGSATEGQGRVGRSTILPLLEFALTQLWERRQDGMLPHEAYQTIGGVTGGLTQWADRTFYELNEEQQRMARRVLTDLVHLGDESQGLPDSRRRRPLETFCRDEGEREAVHQVVRQLADARLLVTGRDLQSGQETVELIHDALLQEWGLLQRWLRDDRRFLAWRQAIEGQVQAWVESSLDDPTQRDKDRLLRGRDLAEAERWLAERRGALRTSEQDFIQASACRERRRRIVTIAAVAVAFALISLAALLVWQQRNIAVAQQRLSRSRELAMKATSQLEVDPERSILMAIEAVQIAHTLEAEDALRRGLLASHLRATLRGHEGGVNSVAFSPDGRRVVTASTDGTARVWDVSAVLNTGRDTGKEVAMLHGHGGWVNSAAFSPDGQWVVTTGTDGTAWVWDVSNALNTEVTIGQVVAVLRGHGDRVFSAAFSPDGQWVVTASDDGTARVWEAVTGKEVAVLRGHEDWVWSAAFSPDGQWVVTASRDGTARVWEAATGKEVAVLHGHSGVFSGVWSAAYSPDGRWIVTASSDHTARVWDVQSGQQKMVFEHTSSVDSAAFSPDGQWVVTTSFDGTARVWEAATGKEVAVLRGHGVGVNSAAFSPDGRWVVTGGGDGTARVWEALPSGEVAVLRGHEDSVNSAAFSPDGEWVVTASDDSTAQVWEAATGKTVAVLQGHKDSVSSAAFSPDGEWVVTASDDSTAQVWEAATGKEAVVLHGHEDRVLLATFSPDGQRVVTASSDSTARVWEAATGVELAVLRGHGDRVWSAAFSPDGQWVVTASDDGTARVWEAVTGKEVAVLRGHEGGVRLAMFSPDGQWVVTASDEDETTRVWEAATGQGVTVLQGGHERLGNSVSAAFSPDGKRIVTISPDGAAWVWESATGRELTVLRGHEVLVNSAVFSPDGRWVLTTGMDGTARVWEAATGVELAVLRGYEGDLSWVSSAVFSPDGRWVVTAGEDGTAHVYATHIEDLLDLAQQRVTRELTCRERVQYLHEDLDCGAGE